MGMLQVCCLVLCCGQGLSAYALHEAMLPLMSDDRLYDSKPVELVHVAPVGEKGAVPALDMTMTGTGG